MKKLTYQNQKGGVGKSILAYNNACFLAEKGYRVALIDGDEQGNSSKTLAMHTVPGGTDAGAFFGDQPIQVTWNKLPSGAAGQLVVFPGGPGLRVVEKSTNDGALLGNLKARLQDIAPHFDYCVIDTPGSNSKAANAFLVASDFVVVPCIVDTYSLDVATKVLQRIVGVQKQINPALKNLGILVNLFDATAPSQKADLERLLSSYHQYVLKAKVSKKSAYREAATMGVPVWKLDKTAAREAGKEIRGAFELMLEKMGA